MKSVHSLSYIAFIAIFLFAFFGARTVRQSDAQTLSSTFLAVDGSLRGEITSQPNLVVESPELVFVEKTGIRASTPPITVTPKVLGVILGEADSDARPDILRYSVEQGDTPLLVAQKFSVSLNTILWANDLQTDSFLRPGKELVILPVSGTLHMVRPGDTLSEIALWYKANAGDIEQFNNVSSSQGIFAGDILIIPNGVMPRVVPQGRLTLLANSYFIWPVPAPHRITQGLHPFNAIDMSTGECGDPIYAAAGGEVQKVGYTSLGGNYARILHPNGVVTYYGHMSAILALMGQKVFQGQTIGYIGHTGVTVPAGSVGCHLHFEVRGAANPFGSR